MPILNVMTTSGPQSLKASQVPGSADELAVVDKWNDGPYSQSVVAPLPGTDVYVTVASPHDLDDPRFPHGQIGKKLTDFIDRLPTKCREYANTSSSTMAPLDLAVARYLGVLSTEQIENHARLVRESRAVQEAARDQEARARAENEARAAASLLISFRRGEKITGDQFETLLELAGIKVAPSTLGSIRKNLVSIQIESDGRISATGRHSKPTSTLLQLARQLYQG